MADLIPTWHTSLPSPAEMRCRDLSLTNTTVLSGRVLMLRGRRRAFTSSQPASQSILADMLDTF